MKFPLGNSLPENFPSVNSPLVNTLVRIRSKVWVGFRVRVRVRIRVGLRLGLGLGLTITRGLEQGEFTGEI